MVALVLSAVAVTMALTDFSDNDETQKAHGSVRELFSQQPDRGYSLASRYGDLVWTAGHLPESALKGDVRQQTEAVMDSIEATLEEGGASFDTVLMTNVYLTDFDDWDAFNTVYTEYFPDGLPPRVTVQIGQLGFGADIEISMLAHVRDQ
jgi:2-iminobutanoate/2-iminopropanoate deaminase